MTAVQNALARTRSISNTAHTLALTSKSQGGGVFGAGSIGMDGFSQLSQFQQQGANRLRYALFHGWVHAAINAIAMEAAGQPVRVGQPATKKGPNKKTKGTKAANDGLQMDLEHPLLESLESPNNIQDSWQFVYSFVANLCLTGWSFVVTDENAEGKKEFYSIPTTWVQPDHSEGAFSRFKIINPNNPSAGGSQDFLDRSQVSYAYFPNPGDPFAGMSLTQAQQRAVKIDDHIQTSQSVFFENGVFPSVIVTVGTQPHPQVPAGVRPRLNATQRRQIYAAIKKVQGGVANYGNPAIVDGLIEKIERLSATSVEMGWKDSELSVKRRILSAFGVHPFILGEEVAGSYAQSYNVEKRFYSRVNVFLNLLGRVMTSLNKDDLDGGKIFWEALVPTDPQMDATTWSNARQRGDVSQNEWRHHYGLPPDEDEEQAEIDKTSVQAVTQVAIQVSGGAISTEQGQAILEGMGLPRDLAKRIAGDGPPEEPGYEEQPPEGGDLEEGPPEYEDAGSEELEKATSVLNAALDYLKKSPEEAAREILELA